MSNLIAKIDPFFKFAFVIIFSFVFMFTRLMWLNIGVFAGCIFLFLIGTKPRVWLKALKLLIPISILAFGLYMTGLRFGDPGDSTGILGAANQTGLNMSTRLVAFASLSLLFVLTTDFFELAKSLHKKAKLPRKFAYGMLCAVNLLPYIRQEYKNARLAFKVRGVRVRIISLKPIFSMLVNCFRWSETLSVAMISKGFNENERSKKDKSAA
ncbi:MAG: energy-coupling factor transporter transmembrane protein EcfT [Erysipelotrichales bacterium]|nr:energy-coupling factor transporter transmembrane protein EcfT [Erysipelotrichales bacterium]